MLFCLSGLVGQMTTLSPGKIALCRIFYRIEQTFHAEQTTTGAVSLTSSKSTDTLLSMKEEQQPDGAPVEVKLPVLFGLRPGVYLTILYGAVLLALLFVLLVLPGITNRGELLMVDSLPGGAAVFVDGSYVGATPLEAFVPSGNHLVEFEKNGYSFEAVEMDLGGRLFASRFFPKKRKIDADFSDADGEKIFAALFYELSGYALIDNYRENYQAPPLIEPVIRDLLAARILERDELYKNFYNLLPNISNETMLHDFYAAYVLLKESESITFSTEREGLDSLVAEVSAAIGIDPGLLELSFGKAERPDTVITAYPGRGTAGGTVLEDPDSVQGIAAPGSSGIEDVRFVKVAGARFTVGDPALKGPALPLTGMNRNTLPAVVSLDTFYIASRETTVGDYRMFLSEHEEWRPERRRELIEAGLADNEYLTEWSAGGDFSALPDNRPLSGISWFAAMAYCDWLNSKLPEEFSGWQVTLPDENRWELAAIRNGSAAPVYADTGAQVLPARFERYGSIGAADLSGSLWEWTGSWYLPLDRLYAASGSEIALPETWRGSERAVRGGSWANRSDLVAVHTRASQDPRWSTPFLGFRPALVRKGTGR
jgi:formylglycine-generating enzyme required for sulfatase activity